MRTIALSFSVFVFSYFTCAQSNAIQNKKDIDGKYVSVISECDNTVIILDSELIACMIKRRNPVLPPLGLSKSSLHGSVEVKIVVGKMGHLVSAEILNGNPFAYESVISSVKKWQFRILKICGLTRCYSGNIKVNYDFR